MLTTNSLILVISIEAGLLLCSLIAGQIILQDKAKALWDEGVELLSKEPSSVSTDRFIRALKVLHNMNGSEQKMHMTPVLTMAMIGTLDTSIVETSSLDEGIKKKIREQIKHPRLQEVDWSDPFFVRRLPEALITHPEFFPNFNIFVANDLFKNDPAVKTRWPQIVNAFAKSGNYGAALVAGRLAMNDGEHEQARTYFELALKAIDKSKDKGESLSKTLWYGSSDEIASLAWWLSRRSEKELAFIPVDAFAPLMKIHMENGSIMWDEDDACTICKIMAWGYITGPNRASRRDLDAAMWWLRKGSKCLEEWKSESSWLPKPLKQNQAELNQRKGESYLLAAICKLELGDDSVLSDVEAFKGSVRTLLQRAVECKSTDAAVLLGVMCCEGIEGPRDSEEGLKLLRLARDAGSLEAQMVLEYYNDYGFEKSGTHNEALFKSDEAPADDWLWSN